MQQEVCYCSSSGEWKSELYNGNSEYINCLLNCTQNASGAIYARIRYVDDETRGGSDRLQLAKPLRILVSKSDVYVKYTLRDINVRKAHCAC